MNTDNKKIEGSVSVGRNVAVGGRATVNGDVVVGHNLRVSGWLYADNVKSGHRGFFVDESSLLAAYPKPEKGWIAGVGTSSPFALYAEENGEWVKTEGDIEAAIVCKSAYDVAVDNGFDGTEEEWLASLVGEKGADGSDGDNGKDATIEDTYHDADGNTVILWSDGTETIVLRGEKGDKGDKGDKGEDGRDGGIIYPRFVIEEGEDGRKHLWCVVPQDGQIDAHVEEIDGINHLILEI